MVRIGQNVKFSELFYTEYFIFHILKFLSFIIYIKKKKLYLEWNENIKFSEL